MSISAHELTQDELLTKIEAAFITNSRPAEWPHDEPVSLSKPGGLPAIVSDECLQAARTFAGLDWTSLDTAKYEQLSRGYAEPFLSFHSHEAFKYYLPAYLKMLVESERAREHLLGPVLHALTPTTDARKATLRDWQEVRLGQFSAEQVQAVLAFLTFAARSYGAASGKIDPQGSWDDFAEPRAYWAEKARTEQAGG